MVSQPRRRNRAFTLIELLVVIAIIAMLIAILLPSLSEARKSGRLGMCGSNLKQMGTATHSYGADFQDRIFSFSWKGGQTYYEADSDIQTAGTDVASGANQAVHIIRTRGDRTSGSGYGGLPPIGGWIPHVLYTHLVLQDYLQSRLPEPMVACPEDWRRKNWQIDPKDKFDSGWWQPDQPPDGNAVPGTSDRRWPYSSSYEPGPAAYDFFQSSWGDPSTDNWVVSQATFHNAYSVHNNCRFGNLRLSDVQFASGKVHLFDYLARHFAKLEVYYGWTDARQPLLMFDGSVNIRMSGDGNKGWHALVKATNFTTIINYTPADYEPRTRTGNSFDQTDGYYQWTRGGLKGIDYGASEVRTGNPG
jgi:prepilin-type N-terminal cleavage/methylation domain-containing protein